MGQSFFAWWLADMGKIKDGQILALDDAEIVKQ
jgi:hypothetical protein